ncbi:MAG: response regulator transcription factor [Pygmaiobacter sp.]|jgi:DNA-binding response OmpR family regulator|nr:response regulator transcription factor [Pygmaiobacter sp.]
MKPSLLVVEDDPDINGLLCELLRKQGYLAQAAFSGSEALLRMEKQAYHTVLVDLMLPGLSGEQLVQEIRKSSTVPVIVISAKSGQTTKIELLQSGADDFITKPFDTDEVAARVAAQLRRYLTFGHGDGDQQILRYGGLVLNTGLHEAQLNGAALALTGIEFELLALLLRYPEKVFTKANLFETVWQTPFLGEDNTLNVHISNLRSKLAAADPEHRYIETVWGIGYRMAKKS